MIYLGLIPAVAFLDKYFKDAVEAQDKEELPVSVLHDRLNITRAHNSGMTLSLLENKPDLVRQLQLFETGFLTLWYIPTIFKKKEFLKKVGGALVLGGAASNLYDRYARGYVVDYLQFKKKPWNMTIFNLADVSITAGAVMTMAHVIRDTKKYI